MKKVLAVLMCIILILALAACGGGGGSSGGDSGGGSDGGSDGGSEESGPLKVAFVYGGGVGDQGWFYAHDKGRQAAQEALGDKIETTFLENVAAGSTAERVITDLCDEGYDVIVASSADYEAEIKKIADSYPDTYFLIAASAYSNGKNVESYQTKSYELLYLLGKLAAWLDVDVLGTVAPVTTPMNFWLENAYLMGAQTVNPDATHRVIFVNTYYDPAAERDAALSLIDAGAGCVIQATNSSAHVQAAEEMGVYAMSMYEDMSAFGPNSYVTGEVVNWGTYYTDVLQSICDGTYKPVDEGCRWVELSTGALSFATFGPMVTDELKAKLQEAYDELMADPDVIWRGPIYDNTGALRIPEGEVISNDDFVSMNWWVAGTVTGGN